MNGRKNYVKFMIVSAAATFIAFAAMGLFGCAGRKETSPAYDANASYAETLFDTSFVHKINIEISDEDWQDLNANPMQKTKHRVDITVDGDKVSGVSFSTKGNTSLSSVASDPDSSRYSFKVNFGKYVKGQTYRGLNKLNLNNIYADATYMKDYLSYRIFGKAGVASPLVSYAVVSINGDELGLYIAIEDIGESYLERTAEGRGELYKPETEMLSNMGEGGKNRPGEGETGQSMPNPSQGASGFPFGSEMPQPPEGGASGFPFGSEMPQPQEGASGFPGQGGIPGGMDFGSGDKGASLVYTDDEPSSYPDIFENDVTDADEASNLRVIAALKALSTGEDIEAHIDVDEVIRYFAAHNFVLNYDSYTGGMLHNYYLYENEGRLSMLPWDYNLAFGAFAMGASGDATGLVNTGIDTPLSGASADQRPMWGFIADNEEYLAAYHKVYSELIESWFDSGEFEKEIDALYKMLLPYVKEDPSAFYTADEFAEAYKTLRSFCLLRAQSIKKQLEGTLSASTNEQRAEDRVDASDIVVNAMGTHGAGGMQQGQTPGGPGGMTPPNGQGFPNGQGMTPPNGQGFPNGQGMAPPNGQGGPGAP